MSLLTAGCDLWSVAEALVKVPSAATRREGDELIVRHADRRYRTIGYRVHGHIRFSCSDRSAVPLDVERRHHMTNRIDRVIITGAGSGIGLDMARAFLARGARLVINGRNTEKLESARRGLDPERVVAVPGDDRRSRHRARAGRRGARAASGASTCW